MWKIKCLKQTDLRNLALSAVNKILQASKAENKINTNKKQISSKGKCC